MSKQKGKGQEKDRYTASEEPMIELYMYSLNQEFPKETGHASFLKRYSEVKEDATYGLVNLNQVESQVFRTKARDWSVQWISNEWITNHTKAAGVGLLEDIDPMVRGILREEDFGAILFEPTSDRVFRLNPAGRKLFLEMRAHYQDKKSLDSFESPNFEPGSVKRFVAYLEGAGLWIRS